MNLPIVDLLCYRMPNRYEGCLIPRLYSRIFLRVMVSSCFVAAGVMETVTEPRAQEDDVVIMAFGHSGMYVCVL